MGRHNHKRRRPNPEGKEPRPAAEVDGEEGEKRGWSNIIPENEMFFKYYKEVNPLAADNWDELYAHLKEPLPSTFRLSGTPRESAYLRDLLKSRFFSHMQDTVVAGRTIPPPTSVPWFPEERVWQTSASRRDIRNDEYFGEFHKLLVQESDEGNVMRQELVSMIPPLLLDVQPGQRVLDMCAAPGSKTAQLIEALHGDEQRGIPAGLVVANDVDTRRCYMLVHQTKRLQSPCCVVTNHDATVFPQLHVFEEGSDSKTVPLQFDRVLCDAPCSGDGTIRKNPMIWRSWTPNNGMSLHRTQIKIAYRGLQLLRVGGRLVYSTCSFNPVENEAVVASLMTMCKGAIRLVDVSHELPLLKREPGWTNWKIFYKNGEVYSQFADVPENVRGVVYESMFPPTAEAVAAADMDLSRCVRILPHAQNTGGFFIAVFEKVAGIGAVDRQVARAAAAASEETTEAAAATTETDAPATDAAAAPGPVRLANNNPRKKPRPQHKEDPYMLVDKNGAEIASIQKFYQLNDFPYEQLVTRSENEKRRSMAVISKDVYDIFRCDSEQLRIVNMGVRLFMRHDAPGTHTLFRIMQDGLEYLHGLEGRTAVAIGREDLINLLGDDPVPFEKTAVKSLLEATSYGCCIFTFDLRDAKGDLVTSYALSGWRGKTSAHLLVNKRERQSLLWRVDPDSASKQVRELIKAEQEKKAEARAAHTAGSATDAAAAGDAAEEAGSASEADEAQAEE